MFDGDSKQRERRAYPSRRVEVAHKLNRQRAHSEGA
jgi:hypothetical protein